MKKIFLLCLFTSVAFAQTFTPVTIKQIQQVPYDSLKIADSLGIGESTRWRTQTSPYMGQQVQITALVVVPHHIITFTAHGKTFVVCDTGSAKDDPWSHIFVRYAGTEESFDANGYNSVQAGDIITMKGTVSEFPSTSMASITQFAPDETEPVNIISSGNPLPVPVHMNISDINVGPNPNGKIYFSNGEPVESKKVLFTNVTVTGIVNNTRGTWAFTDTSGNYFSIYDWSYHFTRDTTSVDRVGNPHDPNYKVPPLGTKIDSIQGFICTASGGEASRGYRIAPIYPEDVKYGKTLPGLTTHRRNPIVVSKDSQAVITVKAFKQQFGGEDLANVKLVYRVNNGPWNEVNMTAPQPTIDSLYVGVIPAQTVGDYVHYFIKATDVSNDRQILANSGNLTQYDSSQGFFFYQVVDRVAKPVLTIRDIQYTPYRNGRTPYLGAVDSVGGIITADTSALNMSSISGIAGTSAWYMQSTNQPWSGIWIIGPDSVMTKLRMGDSVVVTGSVQENFDVTRISVSSARVVSKNNPLPEPLVFTTDVFGSGVANGDFGAEPYEGMLVKFNNVTVSDVNPTFAEPTEYEVTNSTKATIVRRDGRNTYSNMPSDSAIGYTILKVGTKIGSLTGIIYYNNNRYKIEPRTNDDFQNVMSVRLAYHKAVPTEYALQQNYPNPFNPTTTIHYALPVSGLTQLKVYNILGQEVATLVHEVQSAGTYRVTFDASGISSGIYFYKLTNGNFTQVKKMLLVK